MTDPLGQLLRQTDQAIQAPSLIPGLTTRAQQKGRRRKQVRRSAAVALVIGLSLGISIVALQRPTPPAPTVATDSGEVQRVRLQLAELNREADLHERLARRIAARERRRPVRAQLELDVDEAAFALVYQADRLARQPNLQLAAADFYRQVASDFPDSTWAPIARERLARLTDRKEG